MEPLETERAISKMSSKTTVLLNDTPIVPTSLTLTGTAYPDLASIVSRINGASPKVHLLDGNSLANQVGDARLLNVVMLGALTGLGLLPFPTSAAASAVEHQRSLGGTAALQAFRLGEDRGVGLSNLKSTG